jgi:hypothetical protein
MVISNPITESFAHPCAETTDRLDGNHELDYLVYDYKHSVGTILGCAQLSREPRV